MMEIKGDFEREKHELERPEEDMPPGPTMQDRFFLGSYDKMRDQYSDVEIDAFMKVLNIKPHRNWEDKNIFHYKLGLHTYEDEAQELDPMFHILSEEERKEAERQTTAAWRFGQEIKIDAGKHKPMRYEYRF